MTFFDISIGLHFLVSFPFTSLVSIHRQASPLPFFFPFYYPSCDEKWNFANCTKNWTIFAKKIFFFLRAHCKAAKYRVCTFAVHHANVPKKISSSSNAWCLLNFFSSLVENLTMLSYASLGRRFHRLFCIEHFTDMFATRERATEPVKGASSCITLSYSPMTLFFM